MNLHLCIPCHSAHPPSMLKSIICSQMWWFWLQCSKLSDCRACCHDFAQHLCTWGHDREMPEALSKEAAEKSDQLMTLQEPQCSNLDDANWTLFLHMWCHPFQVSWLEAQAMFKACCTDVLHAAACNDEDDAIRFGMKWLVVAWSHAKNLCNISCHALHSLKTEMDTECQTVSTTSNRPAYQQHIHRQSQTGLKQVSSVVTDMLVKKNFASAPPFPLHGSFGAKAKTFLLFVFLWLAHDVSTCEPDPCQDADREPQHCSPAIHVPLMKSN